MAKTFSFTNVWRDKFNAVPMEEKGGLWQLRYYQEIAVQKTLEAISQGQKRILLTLATGTGKTSIAFQLSWKLFQTIWSLQGDGVRRPNILFLADRNILADQAYNAFSAFPEDALVRIKPDAIRKKGRVPTNGRVFFTIFQSFMSSPSEEENPTEEKPSEEQFYFGQYEPDFFDFIIIDECHRGGAQNESNWRGWRRGLTTVKRPRVSQESYKIFSA